MEILICSDNHGKKIVLKQLVDQYQNVDARIHCGDIELPNQDLVDFYAVTGNNDYYYRYPDDLVVEVKGHRIYVTHSHRLSFRNRLEDLAVLAKAHNCDIACFGHTHRYEVETVDGVLCINPGSLYYNRDGSEPSYAILSIVDGEFFVKRKLVSEL
ncbi:metallophosphoesterase family protein [Erysipelothrix urinaevulpis]|uniref:metallophosphoesterase family protein n=1 Tax=Erysipelothrix urinaevulpis TaxID=2683717 RepID=UPI001F2D7E06|nr:metallophosphoesterase [Erysipelothrix urinaevulpis]